MFGKFKSLAVFLCTIALVAATSHARAAIVSVSGDTAIIGTPGSLIYTSNTTWTSSPYLAVGQAVIFAERTDYQVPEFFVLACACVRPLRLTGSLPGTYPSDALIGMDLATGTMIDSYILHFERSSPSADAVQLSGSITFDRDVLGFMNGPPEYPGVESLFALPGFDLASSSWLELVAGEDTSDTIILSTDRRTLYFRFGTTTASEDLRIITSIPEPGSLALAAIACLALFAASRVRLN
jgi:hypothetical protein